MRAKTHLAQLEVAFHRDDQNKDNDEMAMKTNEYENKVTSHALVTINLREEEVAFH